MPQTYEPAPHACMAQKPACSWCMFMNIGLSIPPQSAGGCLVMFCAGSKVLLLRRASGQHALHISESKPCQQQHKDCSQHLLEHSGREAFSTAD